MYPSTPCGCVGQTAHMTHARVSFELSGIKRGMQRPRSRYVAASEHHHCEAGHHALRTKRRQGNSWHRKLSHKAAVAVELVVLCVIGRFVLHLRVGVHTRLVASLAKARQNSPHCHVSKFTTPPCQRNALHEAHRHPEDNRCRCADEEDLHHGIVERNKTEEQILSPQHASH